MFQIISASDPLYQVIALVLAAMCMLTGLLIIHFVND